MDADSIDPSTIALFVEVVRVFKVAGYFRLISAVWLSWDTLLTLPTEIRVIWNTSLWSVPVLLYLTIRYLPLFSQIFLAYVSFNPSSVPLCHAWFSVGAWSEAITVLCTHAILIYRLHALYASRKILISMAAWACFNGGVMIAVDVWTQSRVIQTNQFIPGVAIYGCSGAANSPYPDYFWTAWIPALLTEAYLFGLAAWKLHKRVQRVQWGHSQTLSDVLLEDSFKYYLIVAGVELFQTIVWSVLDWEQYTDPFVAAVLPIAGTRLLLNLRAAAMNSPRTPLTRSSGTRHADPDSTTGVSIGFAVHPSSDVETGD